MKVIILIVAVGMCAPLTVDASRTVVSESLFGNDTIVSSQTSDGGYTRTQYGEDFFGNKTVDVSTGHENATEQGDGVIAGLVVIVGVLALVFGNQ